MILLIEPGEISHCEEAQPFLTGVLQNVCVVKAGGSREVRWLISLKHHQEMVHLYTQNIYLFIYEMKLNASFAESSCAYFCMNEAFTQRSLLNLFVTFTVHKTLNQWGEKGGGTRMLKKYKNS